ncbi:hypothetical protein [Hyalangium rubrum]|uniref:Beta-ketoacyl synthase N-terminal domain-containing protein n=1 Tax=Hyalangium rubrum TaxID=3103134 RepID=A0ABU5HDM8_9BACT|nr:hypothetical protein [Hyalangium sp. s54d21]MDY7230922.1 hypothetical protein [Hyalangium sp. s54d21]
MAFDSFPPNALAVTGLGMVSSLGWDAVSSCAAARAGVLRLSPIDGYFGRDPDTGDAEPILGHTVANCTEGFTGLGRITRLGVAALEDLLQGPEEFSWKKTGLILNLSSGLHLQAASSATRRESEVTDPDTNLDALLRQQEQRLLTRITAMADMPIPSSHWKIFRGDQAGFLHVLETAAYQLKQQIVSRCIIGGLDSYVDPPVAIALDELRILKTPSRPQGVLPGECASFLQVESLESARQRGARIVCVLGVQALHREKFGRFSGLPSQGQALADALLQVWEALTPRQRPGRLIGNLTGDERRAYDWGFALSRLQGKGFPTDIPAWHTGLSFGEIGAATAPTAITLAARAFERGYADTQSILMGLSSDSSDRGALHMLAPPRK